MAQFQQSLPMHRGDLPWPMVVSLTDRARLEVLFLSYNNLTGTIPASFAQFQIKQSAAMPVSFDFALKFRVTAGTCRD
eukprot:554889-Hanusia_phi.AAC.7